jgi:hypothetical protein
MSWHFWQEHPSCPNLLSLSHKELCSRFVDFDEFIAVVNDDIGALTLWLSRDGADVNSVHDLSGYSLLALSCALRRFDAVQCLVAAHADIDLRLALLQRDSSRDFTTQYALLIAAEFADVRIVSLLIGAGASLAVVGDVNSGVCHRAALNSDALVLRAFMAAGASPHLPNGQADAPLHWAASNANVDELAEARDSEQSEIGHSHWRQVQHRHDPMLSKSARGEPALEFDLEIISFCFWSDLLRVQLLRRDLRFEAASILMRS